MSDLQNSENNGENSPGSIRPEAQDFNGGVVPAGEPGGSTTQPVPAPSGLDCPSPTPAVPPSGAFPEQQTPSMGAASPDASARPASAVSMPSPPRGYSAGYYGNTGAGPAPAYPYSGTNPQQPAAAYQPPYQGGFPVRCPRCSNIVSTRFCTFCGTDLSTCYTVKVPAYSSPAPYPNQAPPPMAAMANGNFYPPNPALPKKNKTLRMTLLICGISLACILLVTAFVLATRQILEKRAGYDASPDAGIYTPPKTSEDYLQPDGISLREYRQIAVGLSYARVSQIIGGDGVLYDTGSTGQPGKEETYYTYMWYGENSPYAAAYITFVNGAVTAISNEGLTDE